MRTVEQAAIVGAVIAALLAGCVPQPPAAVPEPDPALLALGELLDDEGALPLEAAQRIFATTVEPLDGVEPLDEELPDEFAALAVRRLSASLDDLPPGVADAVRAVVEPAPGEAEAVIEPGARARGDGEAGAVPDELPSVDELRELVAGVVAEFETRTGHDLRIPVRTRVAPSSRIRALGIADGVWDGDRPTACRIAFGDRLFGLDEEDVLSTVAHEVWHCFQLDASPTAFESGPEWMIEGQAEYVGEVHVDGSSSSAESWDTWLLRPDARLPGRSYDAIGLYAVAAQSGDDVWPKMLSMLGRGFEPAVEELFGSSATEAVRDHAMAIVRAPELGGEWESTGPGITDARTDVVLAVPDGEGVEARLDVGRFGVLPVRLQVSASEVLEIRMEGGTAGAVELPGVDATPLGPGAGLLVCLADGGCVCPDGSPRAGAELPQARPGDGAAAVGSMTGGEVTVVAEPMTIEEACEGPGLVGEWTTDVSNVMAALSTAYGALPACSGPWVVTFGADGSWQAGYQATCTIEGLTSTGTARFTGTYTDSGATFTVADIVGEGTMALGGVTMAMPGLDGFRAALAGTVEYEIVGDVLSYVVVTPEGDRVTISLTRSG